MAPTSGPRTIAWIVVVLAAIVGGITVEAPAGYEPLTIHAPPSRSSLAKGKDADAGVPEVDVAPPRLLGTLAHLHNDENLVLTTSEPTDARFTTFLADRVTASSHEIDPRLLALLRTLAESHPGARFEIVSGYRSEKLNEQRRKKGRHVASHSQHSLGQAVDFRLVPPGEIRGVDPRALEKEIRATGWDGGVGVYTMASDWFVHADVGKNRRWNG